MAIQATVVLPGDPPGIITVRAKAPGNRTNDAKPLAGFIYGRRRYAGETFRLNDWKQFSPRWMEFVDEPPADWLQNIQQRESTTLDYVAKAKAEESKSPAQRQFETMFSMLEMQQKANHAGRFDPSTGKVVPVIDPQVAALQAQVAALQADLDAATQPKGKPARA